MSQVSAFETWFLIQKEAERLVAVCPDSMFFVEEDAKENKSSWADLASYIQVILDNHDTHHTTCTTHLKAYNFI